MTVEQMFWFLFIGLIAGWLAGVLVKGHGFGVIGDIIVGMLGAVVGGWLFGAVGLSAYGTLGAILMALVGAVFLLFLIGLVKRV